MCTLMQKDALIERAASLLALIARKYSGTGVRTPEQKRLIEIRRFLYATSPENIDFDRLANEFNLIHQKYANTGSGTEASA